MRIFIIPNASLCNKTHSIELLFGERCVKLETKATRQFGTKNGKKEINF